MDSRHRPTTGLPAFSEADLCELVGATVRDLQRGMPAPAGVTLDSTLDRDLGLDSLGRVELLLRVERAAGVALPEDTLQLAETVADLWRAVQRGRPQEAVAPPGAAHAGPEPAAPREAANGHAAEEAQTLLQVLDAHLRAQPGRTQAIVLGDAGETRIDHRRLADASAAIAAGLQRAGLKPRQTVAIMLPTSPDYFFTYFGILRAGGIPVPIYPPARASQLEDHVRRHTGILANAQAVLLVSVPEAMRVARLLQARVSGLREVLTPEQLAATGDAPREVPVRGDDVAFIQYTSGSTGAPKGVALTHANLLANIRAMAQAIAARPDDVFVSWLPLYHDMGLIGAWLGSLYVGMPLVVMSPLAFLARPQRWLEAITRWRGTLSAGPNFAYELCLARVDDAALAGLDLSSWRLAFNGAEAVSPDTVLRFQQRFAACGLRPEAVAPVYGLAEASVGLLFPPLGRGPRIDRVVRDSFVREHRALPAAQGDAGALRFVASGSPLAGHEVRIVDDEGRALPERVEGRLEFRGPSATHGYWRNPEQTARLFDRGWLDSGDRAYAADGDIYITGRVKDIVIRGGRNLYPQEIEDAVAAVEGVRKGGVAVFGRPDARSGTERLVVLAERHPRRASDDAALREAIAHAVVDAIGEPADEIVLAPPHTVLKTSSGKVRRSACRELVEQGGVGAAPASARRQWLRLALGAAALRLRAVVELLADALFGLRAFALFWLFAPPVWLLTLCMPTPAAAWTLCRGAARALLRLAGAPVAVQGLEHWPRERSCVLVCNHGSYLDGVVLVAALPRPCVFVAKHELATQLVAGRFLRRLGAEFVERFDAQRSADDARRLVQAAQGARALLVFPEGTFRAGVELLPFHLGAFLAAAQAQAPVLPLTLSGTRELLPDGRWWPRRAALAVHIGAPIEPAADQEPFAAAVRLRDAAQSAIARRLGASAEA
ncbi:AMP-binding protein [uncultured Piscinibacter sp.]|uniref:AMP-binding protein n=1 Tax=uncultured Piscinibacter sp. TaxID=1131835 RepID=UPI00262A6ECC|nr:AMP-binding protein [uncultured Piscinibacter sp.]